MILYNKEVDLHGVSLVMVDFLNQKLDATVIAMKHYITNVTQRKYDLK